MKIKLITACGCHRYIDGMRRYGGVIRLLLPNYFAKSKKLEELYPVGSREFKCTARYEKGGEVPIYREVLIPRTRKVKR